jgi:isoleucyl-tRNA synthetase
VEGDWEHYYSTMAFKAEATIAAELLKFAMNGALFRGSKPVMWSVVEKTALAEAEVEYHDYTSDTVWVKFPLAASNRAADLSPGARELAGASVLIWTTTPWTFPGNRAISYSPKIDYGLYQVTSAPAGNWAKEADRYILADRLAATVFKAARIASDGYRRLASVDPASFSELVCEHPLSALGYGFKVPLFRRGRHRLRAHRARPWPRGF